MSSLIVELESISRASKNRSKMWRMYGRTQITGLFDNPLIGTGIGLGKHTPFAFADPKKFGTGNRCWQDLHIEKFTILSKWVRSLVWAAGVCSLTVQSPSDIAIWVHSFKRQMVELEKGYYRSGKFGPVDSKTACNRTNLFKVKKLGKFSKFRSRIEMKGIEN